MEKTDEISKFYKNNELELEEVIEKYTAYVYSIVKARVTKIRTEDAEEIISDVLILKELENMNSEDKDIFMYYYYYSRKIKEIAKILNISESKTKVKLSRIRKKMRQALERKGYKVEK